MLIRFSMLKDERSTEGNTQSSKAITENAFIETKGFS